MRLAILVQHHVVRFDITMHDLLLMGIRQRLGQLHHNPGGLSEVERPLAECRIECAAFNKSVSDVIAFAVLADGGGIRNASSNGTTSASRSISGNCYLWNWSWLDWS